jgi:hypothetical protein
MKPLGGLSVQPCLEPRPVGRAKFAKTLSSIEALCHLELVRNPQWCAAAHVLRMLEETRAKFEWPNEATA